MPLNTSHTLAFSLRWLRSLSMSYILSIWGTLGLILLGFMLTACDRVEPQPMAIADLVAPAETTPGQTNPKSADPVPTIDHDVLISGVIVRRVPLVNGAAYLVQDETSAIWVRTDRLPEETETTILVSGTLKSSGLDTPTEQVVQDRYIQEDSRSPLEATP